MADYEDVVVTVGKEMSNEIGELASALSKAQGEMKGAKKDSENPFFKSSYADLKSVWEAIREPLSKNGLSVVQTTTQVNVAPRIVTYLLHISGQWLRGELEINPVKNDPQGIGSAITYARRYALMAMVGIAPEDDDGEKAMGRQKVDQKVYFKEATDRIATIQNIHELKAWWEKHGKELKENLSSGDYKKIVSLKDEMKIKFDESEEVKNAQ